MGLKYSGTSTSTNSAGKKAIEPSTSLNPNMMATAASDSVEMRSSTDPDSVAMRSVFTVASRKRSLTSKMRSPWRLPWPSSLSVSMPRTESTKWLDSRRYSSCWRAAAAFAVWPISPM